MNKRLIDLDNIDNINNDSLITITNNNTVNKTSIKELKYNLFGNTSVITGEILNQGDYYGNVFRLSNYIDTYDSNIINISNLSIYKGPGDGRYSNNFSTEVYLRIIRKTSSNGWEIVAQSTHTRNFQVPDNAEISFDIKMYKPIYKNDNLAIVFVQNLNWDASICYGPLRFSVTNSSGAIHNSINENSSNTGGDGSWGLVMKILYNINENQSDSLSINYLSSNNIYTENFTSYGNAYFNKLTTFNHDTCFNNSAYFNNNTIFNNSAYFNNNTYFRQYSYISYAEIQNLCYSNLYYSSSHYQKNYNEEIYSGTVYGNLVVQNDSSINVLRGASIYVNGTYINTTINNNNVNSGELYVSNGFNRGYGFSIKPNNIGDSNQSISLINRKSKSIDDPNYEYIDEIYEFPDRSGKLATITDIENVIKEQEKLINMQNNIIADLKNNIDFLLSHSAITKDEPFIVFTANSYIYNENKESIDNICTDINSNSHKDSEYSNTIMKDVVAYMSLSTCNKIILDVSTYIQTNNNQSNPISVYTNTSYSNAKLINYTIGENVIYTKYEITGSSYNDVFNINTKNKLIYSSYHINNDNNKLYLKYNYEEHLFEIYDFNKRIGTIYDDGFNMLFINDSKIFKYKNNPLYYYIDNNYNVDNFEIYIVDGYSQNNLLLYKYIKHNGSITNTGNIKINLNNCFNGGIVSFVCRYIDTNNIIEFRVSSEEVISANDGVVCGYINSNGEYIPVRRNYNDSPLINYTSELNEVNLINDDQNSNIELIQDVETYYYHFDLGDYDQTKNLFDMVYNNFYNTYNLYNNSTMLSLKESEMTITVNESLYNNKKELNIPYSVYVMPTSYTFSYYKQSPQYIFNIYYLNNSYLISSYTSKKSDSNYYSDGNNSYSYFKFILDNVQYNDINTDYISYNGNIRNVIVNNYNTGIILNIYFEDNINNNIGNICLQPPITYLEANVENSPQKYKDKLVLFDRDTIKISFPQVNRGVISIDNIMTYFNPDYCSVEKYSVSGDNGFVIKQGNGAVINIGTYYPVDFIYRPTSSYFYNILDPINSSEYKYGVNIISSAPGVNLDDFFN